MRIKILILLILIPSILKSQVIKRMIGVGLNLPSLIGNTIAFDGELTQNRLFLYTIGLGGMLNNKLQGTFTKIGEATYNHENSGVYSSFGIRYTPRKEFNNIYFFVGAKLLGGYFKQSASYEEPFEDWFRDGEIPDDFYFSGNRVYSKGFFTAFAVESGMNIIIIGNFHAEVGLQYGHHFYTTKKQVSNISSILPGLGSMNFVGIFKLKFVIKKNIE